ncbi:TNF receptor-associated factor family protein DDB_G0272098 [Culicoides brevitarsis]|uniref:TNF receptor-associated factor family protein DDB_G0272098 n=1 Tax=Culicoides brevitarsis TaxID=469753 RepID=UPI00307BBE7C
MKLSKLSNQTNSQDPQAVNSRVFVGNLNTFQCSKTDVERMFQRYGRLAGISMHKGYAFVQFTNPFDARNACHGEDGRTVLSQILDVNMVAEPKAHQTGRKRQNVTKTGNDWDYYYDSYYASTIFAPQLQPRPVKRPRLMTTSQTRAANVLVNNKLAVAATNTLALAQQLQQQQHAQAQQHQQLQQLLSSASSLSPPLNNSHQQQQQPNGLLNNNSHSATNANNNCNLNNCNNGSNVVQGTATTATSGNGNDLLGIGLCNNNNNITTGTTTNGQQQTSAAAAQFMINGQHVVGPFKTYSNPDTLICGNCREMFTDLGELLDHKRTYCKLRFTCKCQEVPVQLVNKTPLSSANLMCVVCKDSFVNPWDLMVHAQAAHMINIYELGDASKTSDSNGMEKEQEEHEKDEEGTHSMEEAKSSDDENCTETGFTVTVTQLQNGEKSRSGSPLMNDKTNELTINDSVQACIVQATINSPSDTTTVPSSIIQMSHNHHTAISQ